MLQLKNAVTPDVKTTVTIPVIVIPNNNRDAKNIIIIIIFIIHSNQT